MFCLNIFCLGFGFNYEVNENFLESFKKKSAIRVFFQKNYFSNNIGDELERGESGSRNMS